MSATIGVANPKWDELYLLLCTIPAGWSAGFGISAADIQCVAKSRGKSMPIEQCKRMAEWTACSEPVALINVLKMELCRVGVDQALSPALIEPGSLWMGDSV